MEHPITPPPELVTQWTQLQAAEQAVTDHWQHIATQASRWGSDQELNACCEQLYKDGWHTASSALHAARRPKPPSLKKQAYDALDTYIYGEPDPKDKERTYNTIRQALEALPND